jgi:hypothetical protein
MLNELTRPVSLGMPVGQICARISEKIDGICELKYGKLKLYPTNGFKKNVSRHSSSRIIVNSQLQPRDLCRQKKLVWGAKFALYENFSSFDCTKIIVVFIRNILHVMGTGRFDEVVLKISG